MKNYRVVISPQAERDLKGVRAYLLMTFGVVTTDRIMLRIEKSILTLSQIPYWSRNASELFPALVNYYYLHLAKNTIFFRVNNQQSTVEIIKIYDNHQNIITHLLSDLVLDD